MASRTGQESANARWFATSPVRRKRTVKPAKFIPRSVTLSYGVVPKHSTVLGVAADSKEGRELWEQLDWRRPRPDAGVHEGNPMGGEYLHVRRKDDPAERDFKADFNNRRWYRVRCKYHIGKRSKAGVVKNVRVEKNRDGKWVWRVHMETVPVKEVAA